jgi:hypoxia up-regulated 1
VLSLISNGLAVGINYAAGRTFPVASEGGKPETHLIYDMGAGSTTATVVRFQGKVVRGAGRQNRTVQEVVVLGSGSDRSLGGDELNGVVLDDMVEDFVKTPQAKAAGIQAESVRAHGRTMAKLWKEAERMRQVLSANTETVASFEGLYEDIDFRYKLSRSKFEEMAASFAERVQKPLKCALAAAKLTAADLDSVILHGGATRTPFVQARLESLLGDPAKLRGNVNSDEAAVFGAALRGAALTPGFRVKEIHVRDGIDYNLGLKWTLDGKGGSIDPMVTIALQNH